MDTPAEELGYRAATFLHAQVIVMRFHDNEASTETFVYYDDYDLLMLETRDALGNRVTVKGNDDRVVN